MLGQGTGLGYAAFGDSAAAINIAHTALQGVEHFRSSLTKTPTGALFELSGNIVGPGVSVTIREVGIFNLAIAGVMFARFLPTTYNFGPGQTMEFSWTGELA